MDRDRSSFLAHSSLDICNPISSTKVDAAIAQLALSPHASILDIGAGKGEILCRACEQLQAVGVAVERSPRFCTAIRERAALRNLAHRIQVHETDAADYVRARLAAPPPATPTARDSRFHASLCIGSTHALGGLDSAITTLTQLTRPGGILLIGEGYWKRTPDPEYLAALGGTEAESRPHHANIDLLIARGLEPLWATTASDDEWDAYEWAYFRNIDDFCRANPNDPDATALLARARAWRHTAQRWGRDTLGFGLYLARTPELP